MFCIFICNWLVNSALPLEFDGRLCIAVHCIYAVYVFTYIHRCKMGTIATLNKTGLSKMEMVVLVTCMHKNDMALTLKRKISKNECLLKAHASENGLDGI